jgi:hypothetical protein
MEKKGYAFVLVRNTPKNKHFLWHNRNFALLCHLLLHEFAKGMLHSFYIDFWLASGI